MLLLDQTELVVSATDKKDRNAVHFAACNKQEGVMKLLLDHPGADIDATYRQQSPDSITYTMSALDLLPIRH